VNRIYFDRDFDRMPHLADSLTDPLRTRTLDSAYRPAFDVVESDSGIDVIVDLPGVTADAVSVVFSAGTLVIAGEKRAPGCETRHAAFHLAERSFGAFTCVLRLALAIDASRAVASLASGELRITLPRIDDRRGGAIQIPIEYASGSAR
jgi:HSP20 family protein